MPVGDRALNNEVYAAIVEQIHRGELRPGDRVSEINIANSLGISRGPVREALTKLAYEGVIVRKPRSSTAIAKLTKKDLEDIRDARSLIEGHVARRACVRINSADTEELRALIAAMESAARERQWLLTTRLNAQFHQTVIRIADSSIFTRLWRALDPLTWLLAPAVNPNWDHVPEGLVIRHQMLLDALLSGDPDHAEEVFREHVVTAAHLTTSLGDVSIEYEENLDPVLSSQSSTGSS